MSDSIEFVLNKAYEARRANRLPEAKDCFYGAAGLARQARDYLRLAESLIELGSIERKLQEMDLALRHYRQAVEAWREAGMPLRLAHTIRHVGDILRESGDLAAALPCYEESLDIYRSSTATHPLDLANTLRGFALLDDAQGRTDDAIAKWREAGALYDRVWRDPNTSYTEADLRPGVEESRRQVARLSAL